MIFCFILFYARSQVLYTTVLYKTADFLIHVFIVLCTRFFQVKSQCFTNKYTYIQLLLHHAVAAVGAGVYLAS